MVKFFIFEDLVYVDKTGKKRYSALIRFIYLMCAMVAQQVLILLSMFTFFQEVSFVFVLSPTVVLVIIVDVDIHIAELKYKMYSFGGDIVVVLIIASIVLVMLKIDSFLGVGTALIFSLPDFFWMYTMIPVYSCALVLPFALCYCLTCFM